MMLIRGSLELKVRELVSTTVRQQVTIADLAQKNRQLRGERDEAYRTLGRQRNLPGGGPR